MIWFVLLHCLCAKVYAQLTISEIYPAPSEGPEWVELYNDSSDALDLTEYSLKDAVGKIISIPGSVLASHSYVLATSSSVLNNSGDTLYLTSEPDGSQIIARYTGSATFEESFIECDGEWILTMNITPGYENPLCTVPSPTHTPTYTPTAIPTQKGTPTPKITVTLTPSPAPSKAPSHQSGKESPALALSVSQKPTPQSFSAKHATDDKHAPGNNAPDVLGAQNTISPTTQPTATVTSIPLRAQSARRSGLVLGSLLLILAGLGYAGYRLYKEYTLARSQKDPYNEESSEDSGTSSDGDDISNNGDSIHDPG